MEENTERFEMRVPVSFLKTIDDWRRKQRDLPPRAEAICRLVERGIGATSTAHPRSKESKHKAAEMAAREIDRLGDHGLTGEEKATRKRRLIKGPREFRDVRGDQSKTKS